MWKGVVYISFVMPKILYGSESWCLIESQMEILRRTERSMVSTMCGLHLRDRKIYRFDVHVGFE